MRSTLSLVGGRVASGLWGSRLRSALALTGAFFLLLVTPPCEATGVGTEGRTFGQTGIFNSPEASRRLSREKLQAVSEGLERVTGWAGIHFERDTVLCLRDVRESGRGSPTARALLLKAMQTVTIFLEDYSRSFSVAFAAIQRRAVSHPDSGRSIPIFSLRLDFEDFRYLTGHPEALEAFDMGFVLLHELGHAVEGRSDPSDRRGTVEPGECEALVNEVRRELGLPLRAHYRSEHVFPSLLSDFSFGRIRFERMVEHQGKPRLETYFVQWPTKFVIR